MSICMKRFVAAMIAGYAFSASLAIADEFPAPYNSEPEATSPMSAEEAAASAILPDGFRCEVFAAEPDVQQPIAMCFDDRGRLWVAECFTYAERPERWDTNLRDRIVILEDSDGDGRADKRTVFWDEGSHLTSIAHVDGGVFALCAPNLLFFPDADGDDVPDSQPVVLLDGFEVDNASHNVVNGLKLGPDGWLYGRHGILCTSFVATPQTPASQRTPINCGIWRYHPQSKKFEVFCRGGTNPWGLDWNRDGQLFYTNTVIGHLWHAIPGAHYERMYGAPLNPHAYEVIGHTADHVHWDTGNEVWSDIREGISDRTSQLGGGHAHMGCLILKENAWPDQYRGNLFTCNLHGRRVNMDRLRREGCGYVASHGKDFLVMKDPFFRGLDLLMGPDGQMWINDWSDTGECHDNTGLHRTSGRIYRVVYQGTDKAKPDRPLPEWLTRRGENSLTKDDFDSLFASQDESQRAMAVRWVSEDRPADESTRDRLSQIAATDSSGLVRLEVAAALQRLPLETRIPLAAILCQHQDDAGDRQQPLMIWYGIADAVPANPDAAIDLASASQIPLVRKLISRRLAEQIDESPEIVTQLLSVAIQAKSNTTRLDIVRGINEALRGRVRAAMPSNWNDLLTAAGPKSLPEEQNLLRELSVLFGDGRARDELLAIASDLDTEPNARRSALESLLRNPTADLLPMLKTWVNDKVISREAVRGLAYFDGPGISQRLINYWKRDPVNRSAAIDSLVARRAHAADLLAAVADGTIPRDAISPFQARQIDSLGDTDLSGQLNEIWGNVRESPEDKKRELSKWKLMLTPESIAAANVANGKAVFLKQCANCHQLYSDGNKVGPNLTGSDRHNLDYLLANMVDPSAVVPANFRMVIFRLEDGRVLSGVITTQNDRSITILTPEATKTIDRDQVVETKPTSVSIMPDGVLAQLSVDAVRDLVAYLMSSGPIDPNRE